MGTTSAVSAESRFRVFFSVEIFEKVAKVGGIVIVGLYVLGLMVTNEYLMSWGLSDFATFRPKSIITGTWALLFFLCAALPFLTPFVLIPSPSLKSVKSGLRVIGAVLVGSIAGFLCVFTILNTVMGHQQTAILVRYIIEEIILVSSAFILWAVMFWCAGRVPKIKLLGSLLLSLTVVATAVAFTYGLSRTIYDKVPEAFGGGQSVPGHLILNKDGVRFWKRISGKEIGGDAESVVSAYVNILYQNDREMVLRVPVDENGQQQLKLVVLNKSLVDGFLPDEAEIRHQFGY
jgi:hypothetical protein